MCCKLVTMATSRHVVCLTQPMTSSACCNMLCICAAGGGKAGSALATLGQLHGLAAGTVRRAAAALPGPTPQQLRAFAAALFSPFEAQLTRCRVTLLNQCNYRWRDLLVLTLCRTYSL